jgi:hypothetical protein
MVAAGIVSVVFRSALWGGQDRRYLEKRSAYGQGPGFRWFVSTRLAPSVLILGGIAIFVAGIIQLG